jgi:hypothetical protein
MNAEMYARVGGKSLPQGNVNVVKTINFVDEEGQPIGKAAHVDPSSGTVMQVVNALIAAGLMASS